MRLWFQRIGAVLVALRRGHRSEMETARQLIHCALDLLPLEQRVKLITEFALDNAKQARAKTSMQEIRERRAKRERERFELRGPVGRA